MSEMEVAVIKVHLEGIRSDISELKDGHKKMTELIGRLVYIEDKFKFNDESHKLLWDKINKNVDLIQRIGPVIETVTSWKKNFNKLIIGAISIGAIEIVRIFFMFYRYTK